jgi:hypothetical protein
MAPEDLTALREHGLGDDAIHDAVQVIGYFNYISRIADALGVEAETFRLFLHGVAPQRRRDEPTDVGNIRDSGWFRLYREHQSGEPRDTGPPPAGHGV